MFLFQRWARALSRPAKSFCTQANNSVLASYGDPRMPDKLYKTIELEMRSAEPEVMKSYKQFILEAAKHLDIEVGRHWIRSKPTKMRWALLKSVHVHRKHLVQYEVRTHYSWIQLHKMTGSTGDTFLEYIERMLPEGIALRVTRFSIEPLPSHINQEAVRNIFEDQGHVSENTTNLESAQEIESPKNAEKALEREHFNGVAS